MQKTRFVIEVGTESAPVIQKVSLRDSGNGVAVMVGNYSVIEFTNNSMVIHRYRDAATGAGFRDAGSGKCAFEGE